MPTARGTRETAVYRISGVLTVISGWFLTAITALTIAAVMCTLVMAGGKYMACALMLLVLTLLIRSNFMTSGKKKDVPLIFQGDDHESVRSAINTTVGPHLNRTVDLYEAVVKALLNDNESSLRRLKAEASSLFDTLSEERSVYYEMAQQRTYDSKLDRDARYCFYRAYTNMREVGRNLQRLSTASKDHVANRPPHLPRALEEQPAAAHRGTAEIGARRRGTPRA